MHLIFTSLIREKRIANHCTTRRWKSLAIFQFFTFFIIFFFFSLFFLHKGWDIGYLLTVKSESCSVLSDSLQWGAGKGDSEEVGTRFF